jgi:3-oxoacyl-[acyl-carrier protein] reductase
MPDTRSDTNVLDQTGPGPSRSGEGSLRGKTAIVTGAARNIGRAIALALAADGAHVVVNARQDGDAARRVAEEVQRAGGRAIAHVADVTDRGAVEEMVRVGTETFGGIDLLVLNASQRGMKPFLSMSYEEWRRVIDISLDGSFHLAQTCVPHMMRAGWGRIVTLGGMSWYVGTPERVHSLVSKSGLVGFTRGLATELAPHGITVNCVAPGSIDTERPASAGPRPPLKSPVPVGRLGEPGEIAGAVRFLCQPEAGYITGQTLHVNGGSYLGF